MGITAFIGVIGSGKDFRCKLEVSKGATQIDFADKLRESLWLTLGWAPKDVQEYEYFKQSIFTMNQIGVITGRQLIQNMGHELKKVFGNSVWVDQWEKSVVASGAENICVSDCRYPIEAQKLILNNAKFVFCNYRGDRYTAINKHSSERMAQYFLEIGYMDGQTIEISDLTSYILAEKV